jgi:enterochelin esterase family protein
LKGHGPRLSASSAWAGTTTSIPISKPATKRSSWRIRSRQTKTVKLFWIGCGKKDVLIGDGDKRLSDLLTRRGIKHEFRESEGAHTWIEWRAYLQEFASLLFR